MSAQDARIEAAPSSPSDSILDEKKDVIGSTVKDIEADRDSKEDRRNLVDRAERTELTPVEAFEWNVEGDQSPCAYLLR